VTAPREAWFRLLLRLYPDDFRDEVGDALVETYLERARDARASGGRRALAALWMRALIDSLRNGLGERLRPAIAWRRGGNWGRDGELVLRRLRRAPGFAAAVVATLSVGLGAFGAVYAVAHKVLLEPLHYERADDLYFVWRDYTWLSVGRGWLAGTDIAELEAAGDVVESVVGLRHGSMTLSQKQAFEPQVIGVMSTTPNLFTVLGVRPLLGRGFAVSEAGPGRPPNVVLAHDLWRSRFGGDESVLGTEVLLDGQPFRVIGVMPHDFDFVRHASLGPPQAADAYVTFDARLTGTCAFSGLLRARAGARPEEVAAAVARLGATLDARVFGRRGLRMYPVGIKPDLVGDVRRPIVVLLLAGAGLLAMLAINLATLLLARAVEREREFAISRALGADRTAVARATLLEGGALGLVGGLGGALLAVWATRALVALCPLDFPRRDSIAVDWGVGTTVVAIGVLLGLLAGAVPAAWAGTTSVATLLGNTAVRGTHGRLRRGMVTVQVALSFVLLCAGGLLVRSFAELLRVRPGFDSSHVLTMRVRVPRVLYPDAAGVLSLHERVQATLAALPGVLAVGAGSSLPLTADVDQRDVRFPGAPGNTGEENRDRPIVDLVSVRHGYLETLGIHVLAGRPFGQAPPSGLREAVIDRTLAARFFPAGNPIGARLAFSPDDLLTVVGVVDHARHNDLYRDGRFQVYLRNESSPDLVWLLRTVSPPLDVVPQVRAAVHQIDPQLALADVRPMEAVVAESVRQQRLSVVLVAGFSLATLLLATMGLFGIVSAAVVRRRRELAVRMALGATRARVTTLVLREGAALVLLGLLLAVPGVHWAGRALGGMLVGVSPFDVLTLCATAGGMVVLTLTACYLPARRSVRIEPAALLRSE
jgi:predicted permease